MKADFQSFLRGSGEKVVAIGGSSFFLYNRGLIHANALPQYGRPADLAEMRRAMKQSSAMLLRWQERAEVETPWWTMVCRDTSLAHMKSKNRRNVRIKIRQGQSDFSTRRVSAIEVAESAYEAHVAAHERYENASPLSPEEFSSNVLKFQDSDQVEFWMCRCQSSGEVVGWAMFWLDSFGAFLHTIDITPEALRRNAGYGFVRTCLDDYVEARGLPVSNGTRSVAHATGMQDFLRRLGFHREYSRLHVEYPWWMRITVSMLMPLRRLIPHIGPFHLVRAVLDQEKLAQDCQGPTLASRLVKRSFDLLASAVMLLSLSWLLLLCWILASVDTRANGFFRQVRVGRHGQAFRLIKFRTMVEVKGLTTTITAAGDPRITRFGGWLRRTKIDELPQLINVFLGQMSLVGPRPDVPGWADQLTGEDAVVLNLRPGITGPASLRFRDEEKLLGEQEDPEAFNREIIWPAKVELNRDYFYRQSLSYDCRCLLQTFLPS